MSILKDTNCSQCGKPIALLTITPSPEDDMYGVYFCDSHCRDLYYEEEE